MSISGRVAQVVEHLPRKCEALSSNLKSHQNKKKKNEYRISKLVEATIRRHKKVAKVKIRKTEDMNKFRF
jgi:hypothetical protein